MEPARSKAHMDYPYMCCGGQDCGVITSITYLDNGDMFIAIDNGSTAVFPKGFHIQASKDSKNHACILGNGKPQCLFFTSMT